MLAGLRGDADLVIDTSDLNVHQLTDRIAEEFGTPQTVRLKVSVVSFGFKYGIPVDADFLADMRFLPNPHWIPELRPRTGRDPEVADYVLEQPGAAEFLDALRRRCSPASPRATSREGKRFAQVAIGCTGGKHRSVADDRGDRPPAPGAAASTPAPPPRPGAGVTCRPMRPGAWPWSPSAAATGCTPRCPRCGCSSTSWSSTT